MFQTILAQLQDPNPVQRKQAVQTLGAIRHPRARQVLRSVYFNDPDPDIRQQALQYLPGLRAKLQNGAQLMPAPATPREVIWDCIFCGTRDIKGSSCPNCGASRPHELDEKQNNDAPVNTNLNHVFDEIPPAERPPINWRRQRRIARRGAANGIALLIILLVFVVVTVLVLRGFLVARHIVLIR